MVNETEFHSGVVYKQATFYAVPTNSEYDPIYTLSAVPLTFEMNRRMAFTHILYVHTYVFIYIRIYIHIICHCLQVNEQSFRESPNKALQLSLFVRLSYSVINLLTESHAWIRWKDVGTRISSSTFAGFYVTSGRMHLRGASGKNYDQERGIEFHLAPFTTCGESLMWLQWLLKSFTFYCTNITENYFQCIMIRTNLSNIRTSG